MTNTQRSTLALLAALLLTVPATGQEKGGKSDEPESAPRDGADSDAPSVNEQLEGESQTDERRLKNIFGSRVQFGDMETTGDCEPPKDARVDRRAHSDIRSCLDSTADDDSGAEGSVDLRWTVDSDGSVPSASVEDSELDNAELEQCIVDVFEGLSLPEREAGSCRVSQTVELGEKPKMGVAFSGDGRKLKVGRGGEAMGGLGLDRSASSSDDAPQPSADQLEVDGCSPSEVASVLQKKHNAFQYCYEKQLGIDPDLKGTAEMQFEIGSDGHVSFVETAESTLGSRKITACIERVLKRRRYSPPDADRCEVRATFEFGTD